jgi:hypothetical protein
MKKALRLLDQEPLTLAQYVRAEGGETDPHQWEVAPSCSACGASVHTYDMKGALGFKDAAREVDGRLIRRPPGFEHANHAAALDCPLSFPNDPLYAELSKHAYDARRRQSITDILLSPVYADMNRRLLFKLMGDLTCGQGCAQLEEIAAKAMRRLCTMELLGSQPWVFPYLVARLAGVQTNHSSRGNAYQTAFESVGQQSVPYVAFDGSVQWGVIPVALRACFVNKDRHGRTFLKAMSERKPYDLTIDAANQLAFQGRRDLYVRSFTLTSTPRVTRTRAVQLGLV